MAVCAPRSLVPVHAPNSPRNRRLMLWPGSNHDLFHDRRPPFYSLVSSDWLDVNTCEKAASASGRNECPKEGIYNSREEKRKIRKEINLVVLIYS